MKIARVLSALVLLLLGSHTLRGDGLLIAWSVQDVEGLSEKLLSRAKTVAAAEVPGRNREVRSWLDAFLTMSGAAQHAKDTAMLAALAAQIGDAGTHGLTGTSRLIIWERVTSGDIVFEGRGLQVDDDLFTVAGRANWMLRTLTGNDFGHVGIGTSAGERGDIRGRWERWLRGERVERVENRYPAPQSGLEEIRSIEALEGMIASLAPNPAKLRLIQACLKRQRIPGDTLPADPKGRASLCNPDNYTFSYLTLLTGVEEQHDFEWWSAWWGENRERLVWNRETGRFDVRQ